MIRENVQHKAIPFIAAIAVLIIGWIGVRFAAYNIQKKVLWNTLEDNPYTEKVADIVYMIVMYSGTAFVIMIAFQIIGINVGLLMAGVSFGIGFAMQQILENLFAWFLLITNPRIKIGEAIQLLGIFNTYGKIESLQSRYTVVRKFDGRKLVIPNKQFLRTPLQTFKQEPLIRIQIDFRLPRDTSLSSLVHLLQEKIHAYQRVSHPERTMIIPERIDEKGTHCILYTYVNPMESIAVFIVRSDLRKIIVQTLHHNNVHIPYPQQVLNITTTSSGSSHTPTE